VELSLSSLGLRGAEYALKINRSASRIGGQRDVLRTAETIRFSMFVVPSLTIREVK
jgi:hypothetical protein